MRKQATYHGRLPFRECGFEFTAEKTFRSKLKSEAKVPVYPIRKGADILTFEIQNTVNQSQTVRLFGMDCWNNLSNIFDSTFGESALRVFKTAKSFQTGPKWIKTRCENDDCLEIPTPIVKKRSEVKKYFTEFEKQVRLAKLTIKKCNAESSLGGCHIHISIKKLGKARELFLQNIINFLTNYPELNWGFNDPNDVENGNNLLVKHRQLKKTRGGRYLLRVTERKIRKLERINSQMSRMNESNMTYGNSVGLINTIRSIEYRRMLSGIKEITGSKIEMPMSDIKLKEVTSLIRAKASEPSFFVHHYRTGKDTAINYRPDLKTIEFRIFDMPENLTQHILHTEVAQKIFNYCFKKATKNEKIELNISSDFFDNTTEESSIKRFKESMKIIKVDPSRCKTQMRNISQRFEWNSQDKEYGYLN